MRTVVNYATVLHNTQMKIVMQIKPKACFFLFLETPTILQIWAKFRYLNGNDYPPSKADYY
jgi:hypothetical protein